MEPYYHMCKRCGKYTENYGLCGRCMGMAGVATDCLDITDAPEEKDAFEYAYRIDTDQPTWVWMGKQPSDGAWKEL